MKLADTELDGELYLLVGEDGNFRRWTTELGAARMMQLSEDLEPFRFEHNELTEKAWERVDVEAHETLEEYTNANGD
jgi:hypothetical protein